MLHDHDTARLDDLFAMSDTEGSTAPVVSMPPIIPKVCSPPDPDSVPVDPVPTPLIPARRGLKPVPSGPSWFESLRTINLDDELSIRVDTVQNVPYCIRDHYLRLLEYVLRQLCRVYERDPYGNTQEHIDVWTLFILFPRMLLTHVGRGGKVGARELLRLTHS